jgi:branched-chain amino acid transport system ATP-binding protein
MTALLDIHGLHVSYGKSRVLHGVDLQLHEGEIISLLGRNGTGRSTLLKAVMGLVPPSKGSVKLAGRELAGRPSHEIAHAGIGWVPEERLVFEGLSVEENLHIGMKASTGGPAGAQWTVARMYEYFPRLLERRGTRAGNLSGGEQQMLTLCRSLLGNPRVLLVDEPTEGLAPKIVEHLVEVISDIHGSGVAVLLVEQKMTIAMRLTQRCLIMGKGRIVFDGTPDDIRRDDALRKAWLEVA